MPRGGLEKANPTMNGNWLGDGSSEDPQLYVEGKKTVHWRNLLEREAWLQPSAEAAAQAEGLSWSHEHGHELGGFGTLFCHQ